MILSYIQDIDMDTVAPVSEEQSAILENRINEDSFSIDDIPRHNIDKVSHVQENSSKDQSADKPINEPNDKPGDQSFESKYAHFKDKIEKDRLAWESLAKRIT